MQCTSGGPIRTCLGLGMDACRPGHRLLRTVRTQWAVCTGTGRTDDEQRKGLGSEWKLNHVRWIDVYDLLLASPVGLLNRIEIGASHGRGTSAACVWQLSGHL